MSRSVNKFIIVGNLGGDPELRQTKTKKDVCNLSVAVNGYTEDEAPLWVRVVAWDNTAKACAEYLKKGSKVYVEGRLRMQKWEDNEGNERESLELVAGNVVFLDSPPPAEEPAPKGNKSGNRRR